METTMNAVQSAKAKQNLDALLGKVQVYGDSTPVWDVITPKADQAILEVDGVNVKEVEGDYGPQLEIDSPSGKQWISLKNGTTPGQKSYRLAEFEAIKDWNEYDIAIGDTKVFALDVSESESSGEPSPTQAPIERLAE